MKKIITMLSLVLTTFAIADDAVIEKKLAKLNVHNMHISAAPIAGLRTIVSDEGVFYASEDGNYFLQGTLIKIDDNGKMRDLSNVALLDKLKAVEEKMIVFPAKEEKYVVTVFTDISCYYCRKFHHEIKDYNDQGITIRYLAFPREGVNSEIAQQMEAVWQSEDRNRAFTDAINDSIPKGVPTDTIKKHYVLGNQFGIHGTPAILLTNGEMMPGYVAAKDLRKILETRL